MTKSAQQIEGAVCEVVFTKGIEVENHYPGVKIGGYPDNLAFSGNFQGILRWPGGFPIWAGRKRIVAEAKLPKKGRNILQNNGVCIEIHDFIDFVENLG